MKKLREIWATIRNYNDLYQVSNLGNVRTLNYKRTGEVRILRPGIQKRTGYLSVTLNKNGTQKTKPVHRLVAEAFIPNPNNYKIINHIDGNKANNNVTNLEWCTHSHNNKHAYNLGLKKVTENQRKAGKMKAKAVIQYDLDGNYIKRWKSQAEAAQTLNINQRNISSCCRGKYKNAGGYIWRIADTLEEIE